MKKIFAVLFALTLGQIAVTAQEENKLDFPVDEETGKITYQEVVEAEGSTVELFYRAISWMNEHYVNARGMIKKQDKMNGVLIAHVRHDIMVPDQDGEMQRSGRMVYVFKLEFKEGKYRYTITDLTLLKTSDFPLERWIDPENTYYDKRNPKVLEAINKEIEKVIKSLKDGMKKEEEKKDDDW